MPEQFKRLLVTGYGRRQTDAELQRGTEIMGIQRLQDGLCYLPAFVDRGIGHTHRQLVFAIVTDKIGTP